MATAMVVTVKYDGGRVKKAAAAATVPFSDTVEYLLTVVLLYNLAVQLSYILADVIPNFLLMINEQIDNRISAGKQHGGCYH